MNRFLIFIVLIFGFDAFAKTDLNSIGSSIPVTSYIVKEVGSSELLMAKNKDAKVEPASLTKILTSLIAIESGKLDDIVTITSEATTVEPTKAGFRVGDRIRLLDLIKASMISSSNDAAFAIAIYISGSVEEFARVMNYKARLIGLQNSNFTNPAGFDRGIYAGHYSTAKDLIRLTEYAIKNRIFNEIAKLERSTAVDMDSGRIYTLVTHNKLLEKYQYAVGIKTGYTSNAGKCLIARAKKDNKDVLIVMLRAKTDRWSVAEDMFEKAFEMRAPEPELVEEILPEPVYKPKYKKGYSNKKIKSKKYKSYSKKKIKNKSVAKPVKVKKRLKVVQKRGGDKG